ncbi:MAG: hypothetical protein H6597_03580 [Flavobacteriales bacterium]|nr:hypothetical protein [Flavobacteriales bacterium]MCB9193589.1 hypothetical protein [Flavobacteriales bacterium]
MDRTLTLIAVVALSLDLSAQCTTTFPATQDFDSAVSGGGTASGTLPTGWTNLSGDDMDWWVDNGTTPSTGTGPSVDHTTGTSSGNFIYVEASSPNYPGKSAIIASPCYTIGGLSSPYLMFWYNMNGGTMGSLHVDIDNNGSITSDVFTVSGDQGDVWKQVIVNLAPYAGATDLRVRFRGITGSSYQSDICIDDVQVLDFTPVYGCTDPDAGNFDPNANVDDGSCDYSCGAGLKSVEIVIVPDNYPNEISWDLKSGQDGSTIASGGSTGTTLCVNEAACLVFTIHDSYGDGICCSYGTGSYTVYFDGVQVGTGGNYGSQEQVVFNCPPGYSCSEAVTVGLGVHTASPLEYWYDFTPAQTGSYTVTTCGYNTCDTKLWMYDQACNAINVSSNLEGATFADDNDGGCGLQAVITGNMEAGVTYHLRVGDNNDDCSESATFEIIYNGPAVGCMDPNSCNYDPLATVPCNNCCLAVGDPNCPTGPDLSINQNTLSNSLSLATVNITDVCAPAEGCVKALGQRYVIKFSTRIDNTGELDYYIGSPNSQPWMFNTNNCHGHAHYSGYADYVLFDEDGHNIPVGFKNGFCVIDVGCPNGTSHYGCSNMGISAGCYDQYGSGTTCNWIDITDVPAGQYTLVVRTNWNHIPDALGRHETNYANNYAQVCIEITRNAQDVPSFSIIQGCPTWTDCMGQPYGDARYDCTGTCGGTTLTGDLDNDDLRDQADAQEYVLSILGDDITPSTCTDLNNDGAITVTDAAMMVYCYTERDAYEANQPYIHYHPWCEYPRGWLSTIDTVSLEIGAFNPAQQYVDVYVKNPDCKVLGYEFAMSGLTIQSVENLAPSLMGDISVNSYLGGTKVLGLSYLDTLLNKNTSYVPLVRVHYYSLTGTQVCIDHIVDIANQDGNNVITRIGGTCVTVNNAVAVDPKVWLEGPYDPNTQLMQDSLRSHGLIPVTEPYTALGFAQAGGGGGEIVSSAVFDVTGPNAIVDWVLVELRDAGTPSTIVASRCALLQRDGDVVGQDGTSSVVLNAPPGNYYLAVRHRNHLGVMTASPVSLGAAATSVDLRIAGTAAWGTEARKAIGPARAMWAGNTFGDGLVKYAGSDNDRDPILQVIGGNTPTAVVLGYYREDVNLSGVVKYAGAQNDRDPILVNIGGTVPTATRVEQLP